MTRSDLDDFVACCRSGQPFARKDTERFRLFPLETLMARDKLNLDIFWLKDDALDDPDLLPPPTSSRPKWSRAWRRRSPNSGPS